MSDMTTLPTTAQAREYTLAKLRYERLQHQLIVAHYDFIGLGVEFGFIPADSVPLMLAELYGTAEGASE